MTNRDDAERIAKGIRYRWWVYPWAGVEDPAWVREGPPAWRDVVDAGRRVADWDRTRRETIKVLNLRLADARSDMARGALVSGWIEFAEDGSIYWDEIDAVEQSKWQPGSVMADHMIGLATGKLAPKFWPRDPDGKAAMVAGQAWVAGRGNLEDTPDPARVARWRRMKQWYSDLVVIGDKLKKAGLLELKPVTYYTVVLTEPGAQTARSVGRQHGHPSRRDAGDDATQA